MVCLLKQKMKQLWFKNSVQNMFSLSHISQTHNFCWISSISCYEKQKMTPECKYLIPEHREGSKAESFASLVQIHPLRKGERQEIKWHENFVSRLTEDCPLIASLLEFLRIMWCSWHNLLGPQNFVRFLTEFQNSDKIYFPPACHFGCLIQLHVAIFCLLSVWIWPPQSNPRPWICDRLVTLH